MQHVEDAKRGRKTKSSALLPERKEDGKCDDWNRLLDRKGFIMPIYYMCIIEAFQDNREITSVLAEIIVRELIVKKKQMFRFMEYIYQNAAEEYAGFNRLLIHSGQSGADFRKVYSKMDPQTLIEILAHPDIWDSICRYNPKAVFMLLQNIKSSGPFERFQDWFYEMREAWDYIIYHENYIRADINKAKQCVELGLCQDIRITRGRMAAMSVFPITKETVQFTLHSQPDLFLQPLILEIRWDDLWARNSHPEVDLLVQYFVCDCKGNSDTDPLTGILWHMLSEGRKETVNLWNNL